MTMVFSKGNGFDLTSTSQEEFVNDKATGQGVRVSNNRA